MRQFGSVGGISPGAVGVGGVYDHGGMGGGGTGASNGGGGAGGALGVSDLRSVPHSAQKRLPGSFSTPQFGHLITGASIPS
jgi:hypothetical protein